MAHFLIGHDVGTGGSKSVLADADGNILARTFVPFDVSYPQPNWAEQDPNDWWDAVTTGTRRVLEESGADPASVKGIGFAGQMLSIVPVDKAGEHLCPGILWLDSRADEQAAGLIRRMGGPRLFVAVAGALPSGKDIICKVAWLRENRRELFEATRAVLDLTGYLVMRATGVFSIDHTGAAGTGLLDRKRRFSPLLARLVGTPLDKMPEIRSSIDVVGGLTRGAAEEMGLPEDTPVIAGMSDIPAAATGSGALEDGDAHVYLGTSSWLCLSISKRLNLPANGIISLASPDPSMYTMIGESETAGMCLKWFADNLATPGERQKAGGEAGSIFEVLDEVAAGVEPGSGGLLFMPWMFGERAPVTDTTLRGAFANLSLEHRREDMLRSIYEGVAYNLRWMMDQVEKRGLPVRTVRAIGGGARSDTWMAVLADATGRQVEAMSDPQEAGALGVALAVAVGLGLIGDYKRIKDVLIVRRTFSPDRAKAPGYDRLYGAFRDLYPGLSRTCRRLNTPSS
jgi:xylulokinase